MPKKRDAIIPIFQDWYLSNHDMNMMVSNSDHLQYLCSSNGDDLTSVMTINQTEKDTENGNINLNLFVISPKSHTRGEQLRMASRNHDNGESLKNNVQHRKGGPSITDYKKLQAESINWKKEKAALTDRLKNGRHWGRGKYGAGTK